MALLQKTIDRTQMKEVAALDTVDPFGKINYWDIPDGSGRMVKAFIKMDIAPEGAQMGIAIDGSGSMQELFGKKPLSSFLPPPPNHVKPAAQAICSYLAQKSADGKVATAYWATGPGGRDIQVIGDLSTEEARKAPFEPPRHYGTGTRLLPALRYFTDGRQRPDLYNGSWGMYVFITDGAIEDMSVVKQYCRQLAVDIEAGRRNDLKLVMVGLGSQVDEDQLDELDDLDTGTSIDLWDTKLASELRDLASLFDEVVEQSDIIVPGDGIIRSSAGQIVMDYRDTGLPGLLDFILPRGAKSFSLEVGGNKVTQPLP